MRRKKTGSLLTVRGRLVCRWKEGGRATWRHVACERDGRRLLVDVADYRAAGMELAEAIRKAAGADGPAPQMETVTMAQAIARYLDRLEGERAPANLKRDRYRARSVTDHPIAQTRADLVRRRDVARWTDALSEDKGGRTVNRCLSLASKAWTWAYDHGYIPEDQPNPFRLVTRNREVTLDKDHLSREEGRALVEAAAEDFRPLLIVALATGMRRGELLSLAWADVDLEGAVLVIRAENEKAGGGRRVDMTPEVFELLTRLKATARGWPVFLAANGQAHTACTVRNRMTRIRKAEPKIAPHKLLNLKFKDLRDSAICLMLEQGTPTATVARIAGHRTLATTEKYLSELRLGQREAIDRHGEFRFGS